MVFKLSYNEDSPKLIQAISKCTCEYVEFKVLCCAVVL